MAGRAGALRGALILLVVLVELSALLLPAMAQTPARSGAAITETRLRAAPERRANSLLRLPEGAKLKIHGQAENGWYRARRGRLEGYIPSGDVATGAAQGRKSRRGETIDQPGSVTQEQRVPSERNRGQRTGDSGDRRGGRVAVADDLNLRAGPSGEDPVLAVIPRRATVKLSGRHQNGFVEVSWDGQTGWTFGKHLVAPRESVKAAKQQTSWSRRQIKQIIYDAADRYGQPRADMLRVARCESDLVPGAVNKRGGSYGLFQFKPGTWLGTPFAEYDIFDPRASANAAGWMWSVGRRREWVCQ
jgi:uncharacterized protein YraI